MALIIIPYVFTTGAVIIAAQHNSNFSIIANDYNGNIQDVNIASNAAIGYSKLSLSNSIRSTDILSSTFFDVANIPTGTTANKVVKLDSNAKIPAVDGSQLTNLTITGLGTWTSKSASTIYQALTDGFLVGSTHTDDGNYFEIRTDSNATPTTVRMAIGNAGSTTTDVRVGFCCPIKKNDYYRIIAQGSGDVSILEYCFFISIGV
jgi:hypothetical protein